MSTAIGLETLPRTLPGPRRPDTPPRTPLRAVPRPAGQRRPRVAYALTAVAGALAIAAVQMVLSILTTQTSYELSSLASQQKQLTWQRQILADDVAGLGSPQYLAANATALGMVVGEAPSYLRLSDGALLGASAAAAPASTIDALNRGAVGNALVATTPLVTDGAATIAGPVTVPGEAAGTAATEGTTPDATTPPPVTEGLPTPATH